MKLPQGLTKALGKAVLSTKANSPHILFAAGVVSVVGGAVLACRATLKLDEALDDFKDDVHQAKLYEAKRQELMHFDRPQAEMIERRRVAYVYGKHTAKLVILYAPGVGAIVLGIGLLTGSHVQLTKRNANLAAAYAAVSTAYQNYRERVKAELGEERERDIYYGVTEQKDPETKELVKVVGAKPTSPYYKEFNSQNPNYVNDVEANRNFILCQQEYANQRLKARGYLFLNDAYRSLGLEPTKAGQQVGWLSNGKGDGYVDFGIFAAVNTEYANGWDPVFLLDFNVDGYILSEMKEIEEY